MNVVWQELHLATDGPLKQLYDDERPEWLTCLAQGHNCGHNSTPCDRCSQSTIKTSGNSTGIITVDDHIDGSNIRRLGMRRTPISELPSAGFQLVLSTSQDTTDWVTLLQSIDYYNFNVVPHSKPAHLPYRRQTISTKYWDLMPAILRYLWIVTVGAMQAGRTGTDLFSNSQLVQYRGRSLKELQQLMMDIPEAVKDPYGIALYSILFLMGSEMQLPDSKWSTHLEAARKLIKLRGGLAGCFDSFHAMTHAPLIVFLMTDIVTATTCPSRLLDPTSIQTQRECLGILPKIEEDLIANGYSYPLPLLMAIVRTNILRAHKHHS